MTQSGQITRRTARAMVWALSGSGMEAALRILTLIVLARLLEPAEFGVMGAALIVIGFVQLFSELGVGPAIVQREDLTPSHIRVGFTISVLLSLVLAGTLLLVAPLVAAFFDFPDLDLILRVIAFMFPLSGVTVVAESLMRRELEFRRLATIDVITYGLGYGGVGLVFALLGFGVWSLVFANVGRRLLSTILILRAQRHPYRPSLDRTSLGDLLRFGGGFTLARVLNFGALQGDNLVTGRFLGADALGVYGRAYQLLVFPVTLIGSTVDQVLFPAMAKVQTQADRLAKAFLRGATVMALTFAPLSVMAFVFAPEVVAVALGPSWEAVTAPFQILAAGMLFRAGYKVSDSLARATGVVYRRAWRQGVYAGAVLLGALVGQRWGLEGLSIGVLLAVLLNFVLMSQLSLRVAGVSAWTFISAHGPGLALAAVAAAGAGVTAGFLRAHDVADLVVLVSGTAVVGLLLGLVIWLVPGVLGRERRWMVDLIRGLNPARRSAPVGANPVAEAEE